MIKQGLQRVVVEQVMPEYIDVYMHAMADISAIFGNRTELDFYQNFIYLKKRWMNLAMD